MQIVNGVASGFAVESAYFYVQRNGKMEDVSLNTEGFIRIFDGGSANSAAVGPGCSMYVSYGGVATNIIENGGFVTIDTRYGSRYVSATFAPNEFSSLVLSSGASATVHSGTTANSVTVSSGAFISVYNGGKLTGQLIVESGANVYMADGVLLDFDISGLDPDAAARVNNLGRISTSLYSLTVSDRQNSGVYALAKGAYVFDSLITVRNALGESLGAISVDAPLETELFTYSLGVEDGSLFLTVVGPDWIAPVVSDIRASAEAPTNRDVVLTAVFSDDRELAESLYRIGENGEWTAYEDGVVVTGNMTVFFKAVDTAGNESEIVSYEVTNIDKEPPVISLEGDNETPLQAGTLTASTEPGLVIFYSIDQENWVEYTGTIAVVANAVYYFMATDAAGNIGTNSIVFENIILPPVSDIAPQTQTWEKTEEAGWYIVEYSTDNFEHAIRLAIDSNSLDSFQMPAETYTMRVKPEGGEWTAVEPLVAEGTSSAPKVVRSNEDGNADVFFANSIGTWESGYLAQHVGSINDWSGTNEYATVFGKNKLADIIVGSTDANILLMTDDDNGDGLFVDDIYSALPGSVSEQQSRIAQIDEIRAGFGNDIVDMTSQRFEYIGDGLTIRGGEGNDVIWANKGENMLFGDAGNDRIVGASGNDVIAGGIGNDRMHGGGGNDVFTFCDNWGADTVEQLATGSVTLWFLSGSEANWNKSTLTYMDGDNSVKVSGVAADKITLKFGNDGSAQFSTLSGMGAFFDATTERIFEESSKGILASL